MRSDQRRRLEKLEHMIAPDDRMPAAIECYAVERIDGQIVPTGECWRLNSATGEFEPVAPADRGTEDLR